MGYPMPRRLAAHHPEPGHENEASPIPSRLLATAAPSWPEVPSLSAPPVLATLSSQSPGGEGAEGGGGGANDQVCRHALAPVAPATPLSSLAVRCRKRRWKTRALSCAEHCLVLLVMASGQPPGTSLPPQH